MDVQQLERDLEDLNALRSHPGYSVLASILVERKAVIENIRTCPNDQTLWFRQGQLDIIDFLDNLESFVSTSLEELTGAEDEDYS